MTTTLTTTALSRTAEALLRALGGETVTVIFPVATAAAGNAGELGLAPAATEEVAFAPVVVRSLPPDKSGRSRHELLFAATAVAAQLELRTASDAVTLFQSALGVLYQDRLLHIESVTPEFFAGSAYLYRVGVME